MAIQVSGTTVINDSRKVLNLQGMRVPTYSSDPSSPSGGDVYLNTANNKLYVYGSTIAEWVQLN